MTPRTARAAAGRWLALAVAATAATGGCDRQTPAVAVARTSAEPAPSAQPPAATAGFDHVLIVSVDGLRSDVLGPPHLARLPAFSRLLEGAFTLDARTDPDITVTLPNHISMLTGRFVAGETGHGWIANDDPPGLKQGGTLHASRSGYVPSAFDVAHDAGVSTAVIASKTKFWLLKQSYGGASGAVDAQAPDFGRSKIDLFLHAEKMAEIGGLAAHRLRRAEGRTLDFVHFAAPDSAGHAHDWLLEPDSKYLAAIAEVDRALGEIFAAIDGSPSLRGRTAIVLTADHGGGVPAKTHTDASAAVNFRIPFVAWTGDGGAMRELYELNPDRRRPDANERVAREASTQPIRNGDAANLALRLLALPPVPGSTIGASSALSVDVDAP